MHQIGIVATRNNTDHIDPQGSRWRGETLSQITQRALDAVELFGIDAALGGRVLRAGLDLDRDQSPAPSISPSRVRTLRSTIR